MNDTIKAIETRFRRNLRGSALQGVENLPIEVGYDAWQMYIEEDFDLDRFPSLRVIAQAFKDAIEETPLDIKLTLGDAHALMNGSAFDLLEDITQGISADVKASFGR